MIQETSDEYGMLEDFTIEYAGTVESAGSGDSGVTVVEMDTSGNKTKRHHMDGPYAHVNLDHNSLIYGLFNLMKSEEFRSSILQECNNMRASM